MRRRNTFMFSSGKFLECICRIYLYTLMYRQCWILIYDELFIFNLFREIAILIDYVNCEV
jgi:hypothetical protein